MSHVIIDVREPFEFAGGHVEGAVNISASQMMSGAQDLVAIPKDADIIVYCRSGSRASVSTHILRGLGYKNVTNGINREQVEARFLH